MSVYVVIFVATMFGMFLSLGLGTFAKSDEGVIACFIMALLSLLTGAAASMIAQFGWAGVICDCIAFSVTGLIFYTIYRLCRRKESKA